ncbi:dihydropteroate synthase [Mycobacteroides abscessus subsp. abscessus]|nr:dihydropteroate synthase [Mycobacteroides abscessus subsp. abscessus]
MNRQIINCGPYELDYGKKTLVMGILNATPDSFSDGGKYFDAALTLAGNRQGRALTRFLQKKSLTG